MTATEDNARGPVDEMRSFLKRKNEERRLELARLHSLAKEEVSRIIAHLSTVEAIIRVWQWGSLLHPDKFTEISDIDIAIEGHLTAESFFRLLDEVQKMATFPVDLVEMEKLDPVIREWIKKTGKLVHER